MSRNAPPPTRPDHDEMRVKIETVVGLGVSARQARGLDDEAIRRETLAVAIPAFKRHARDEWEVETFTAMAQREIDRLLAGGPPRAALPPVALD